MSSENPEQSKKESELSPEIKELLLTFQQAKQEKDEERQNGLLLKFREKLLHIVIPPGESLPSEHISRLRKVLLEGSQGISNYIPVGGGTDGQRIWFRDNVTTGDDEVSSTDGKPRWMAYYEPEGSSRSYGERYWKRYMEAFGNQVVWWSLYKEK